MRRTWRRWGGRGALLALLLQLALPLSGLPQAMARTGPEAPLLICTGTGLVWVDPDGKPIEDKDQTDSHCPLCPARTHVGLALLLIAPTLLPLAVTPAVTPAAVPTAAPRTASAPPLPARGPPRA